jgi:hypothetical protein
MHLILSHLWKSISVLEILPSLSTHIYSLPHPAGPHADIVSHLLALFLHTRHHWSVFVSWWCHWHTAILIQGSGRWSSNAFPRYIQKNLIILHALIMGHALHYLHVVLFLPLFPALAFYFVCLFGFSSHTLLWTVLYRYLISPCFVSPFPSDTKKNPLHFHHSSYFCSAMH